MDVPTVKFTLLAPAGTLTLKGTCAAPLLLKRPTIAPPAGAGPVRVTVPVDDPRPPTMLEGFNVREERVGSEGVTVSEADRVTPL